MERWIGKIAVVTGASSGIGSAIVKNLVNEGLIVIGLARREDRLKLLKDEIKNTDKGGEFHYFKCDVSDLVSVKMVFDQISKKFKSVHVLVNNAGIATYFQITGDNNEANMQQMLETNLMGPIYCIKETYKIMKATQEECHIINVNSILGHSIPFIHNIPQGNNVYPCAKFGLRAAGEVIRQELIAEKNFRISNISPGMVKTDIAHAGGHPFADRMMQSTTILLPEDIAQTIKFVLEVPKHVQISQLTVIPVGQKF